MEPIYVVGHQNPDTDSIVAAMAYAGLRNALGDREFVAARLGEPNDETKLVLDKFGFKPPMMLTTLRTQVRDLEFDVPPALGRGATVSHAWNLINQSPAEMSSLPVTDEEGKLFGMLTAGDIAGYDMQTIRAPRLVDLPLFNLLSTLEGQLINECDTIDLLSGELLIALPQPEDLHRDVDENSIVICGQQPDVLRAAIQAKAPCVIVCEAEVPEEFRGQSDTTCIICTPFDAYRAARMIYQAIPVRRICPTENIVSFHLDDFVDDVREATLRTRFRSYPILDEEDRVVGTLSRFHLLRPRRKRVVLVDHNESTQSVEGLEQGEVLEIIDHHRLADVETGSPIYFRNEPVGSTCTIVTSMFQERGIMPSKKMAGLMAAAIVSDTVMFKSPTCTPKDKRMAERMARIAGVSLDELGHDMFSISSPTRKDPQSLLFSDFKEFHIAGHAVGVGQITCMDSEDVLERSQELLDAMQEILDERDYDAMLLMLTDVLKEGTQLLVVGDEQAVGEAFKAPVKNHAVFLPGVMSRKKQIIPPLSQFWS